MHPVTTARMREVLAPWNPEKASVWADGYRHDHRETGPCTTYHQTMPATEGAVGSTPKANSHSTTVPTAMTRNQITHLQLSARAFRKPIDVNRNRISETAVEKASRGIELAEELAPANGLRT